MSEDRRLLPNEKMRLSQPVASRRLRSVIQDLIYLAANLTRRPAAWAWDCGKAIHRDSGSSDCNIDSRTQQPLERAVRLIDRADCAWIQVRLWDNLYKPLARRQIAAGGRI